MSIEEFFTRVSQLPEVHLVGRTPTACVLRCDSDGSTRDVRLGLWAVREFTWEKLATGLQIHPTSR
ncbi:hypothetical protein HQ560_22385 [bacterium]|nr:hypothetical protein [bacterium]